MGAGKLLVDMLTRDNDGRLGIYFLANETADIVGVSPADSSGSASMLNVVGHFGMSWKPEFLSWYENSFIIAECYYRLNNEEMALQTLNYVLEGIEARWSSLGYSNISIPRYSGVFGDSLLQAIMNEKYKALFLNIQSWSDWRRTEYPQFIDNNGNSTECGGSENGEGVPRRLLYPEKEKSTNPNCPQNDNIYERLENDPN
tara:strand:- start:1215 stop:1817 length:603 start_codon:yes stop_codon:yes gene_type:complete